MRVHVGTIRVCPRCGCEHKCRYVPVEVANELERELAELRAKLAEQEANG